MPHCDEGAVCLDRGTVAVSDFALRTLNLLVVRVGVPKRDHGAAMLYRGMQLFVPSKSFRLNRPNPSFTAFTAPLLKGR
jgi:hypothetical protein